MKCFIFVVQYCTFYYSLRTHKINKIFVTFYLHINFLFFCIPSEKQTLILFVAVVSMMVCKIKGNPIGKY